MEVEGGRWHFPPPPIFFWNPNGKRDRESKFSLPNAIKVGHRKAGVKIHEGSNLSYKMIHQNVELSTWTFEVFNSIYFLRTKVIHKK